MNPFVLWTDCVHNGVHLRDLTMSGAFTLIIAGAVGWAIRALYARGHAPSCAHGRNCANCGVSLNWRND